MRFTDAHKHSGTCPNTCSCLPRPLGTHTFLPLTPRTPGSLPHPQPPPAPTATRLFSTAPRAPRAPHPPLPHASRRADPHRPPHPHTPRPLGPALPSRVHSASAREPPAFPRTLTSPNTRPSPARPDGPTDPPIPVPKPAAASATTFFRPTGSRCRLRRPNPVIVAERTSRSTRPFRRPFRPHPSWRLLALPLALARHGRRCHGAAEAPDASALTRTRDGRRHGPGGRGGRCRLATRSSGPREDAAGCASRRGRPAGEGSPHGCGGSPVPRRG